MYHYYWVLHIENKKLLDQETKTCQRVRYSYITSSVQVSWQAYCEHRLWNTIKQTAKDKKLVPASVIFKIILTEFKLKKNFCFKKCIAIQLYINQKYNK